MKVSKFPKIGQFRNVVTEVKHSARFEGLDENDQPKYNNKKLPTIEFVGTVKLHGTNAGVMLSNGEVGVQSRNEIVGAGHFGFHNFVSDNINDFKAVLDSVVNSYSIDTTNNDVVVYGEWCGPGIQKSVAISNLPHKMFVIFGAKVRPHNEDEVSYWVDHSHLASDNDRIRNIFEYPVFREEIDFSNPKLSINKLVDITNQVEAECPVGAAHGIKGVGEGVVWVGKFNDNVYKFKVKGEKHSATKVKKLASVDPEKLKNIQAVLTYLVTEQRLEQALQETNSELDRKATGDVMRWLVTDIGVEERDTLKANNLLWKDVAGGVMDEYRRMFFEKIDNNL